MGSTVRRETVVIPMDATTNNKECGRGVRRRVKERRAGYPMDGCPMDKGPMDGLTMDG